MMMGNRLPDLEEVLEYTNEDVVDSFMESFDVSKNESIDIFKDMLRFLWLCRERKDLGKIDSPIIIIDEMWHIFILYAKDYNLFCKKYMGRHIVHRPTPPREKNNRRTKGERKKVIRERRERYISIYQIFGNQVFSRWYLEFPEKYSKINILNLRKK